MRRRCRRFSAAHFFFALLLRLFTCVNARARRHSSSLRNDEFLAIVTPTTQAYAEKMTYVYNKFSWDACAVPKAYKHYVDTSLMNASAWVHPAHVDWLQTL